MEGSHRRTRDTRRNRESKNLHSEIQYEREERGRERRRGRRGRDQSTFYDYDKHLYLKY